MKKLTTFILSTLILAAGSVQGATQTIKAEVHGLVCPICEQRIDSNMRSLSQTRDVYVNLGQRVVAVEINEGQTLSHDAVKDLMKNEGYVVTKIETLNMTARQVQSNIGR